MSDYLDYILRRDEALREYGHLFVNNGWITPQSKPKKSKPRKGKKAVKKTKKTS